MAGIGLRPRYLAALLVAGSVAIAACGGDDDDSSPFVTATPSATATNAATETVAGASTVAATATTTPTEGTYTVVAGDTLGAIAERFGTTVEAIVEANNIADANVIEIGQVLVIPEQ